MHGDSIYDEALTRGHLHQRLADIETNIKPMLTREEIFALCPQHALEQQQSEAIEAARRAYEFLETKQYKVCEEVDYTDEDREGAEFPEWWESYWSPVNHYRLADKLSFELFGIDFDAFMAEKDLMLKQLRLRHERDDLRRQLGLPPIA